MSYQATYDLLIADGSRVVGNMDSNAGDNTAAPVNITVARRDLLDNMYRMLAAQAGTTPDKITEAQLIASFGLTDEREL